jgi:hypothetical protein
VADWNYITRNRYLMILSDVFKASNNFKSWQVCFAYTQENKNASVINAAFNEFMLLLRHQMVEQAVGLAKGERKHCLRPV